MLESDEIKLNREIVGLVISTGVLMVKHRKRKRKPSIVGGSH